jgi:hypothetical protein
MIAISGVALDPIWLNRASRHAHGGSASKRLRTLHSALDLAEQRSHQRVAIGEQTLIAQTCQGT